VKDFKHLSVWQKAHLLTMGVYKLTSDYPQQELYGLTAQMRRACVSIPSNIAEGCGRKGEVEFGRFLQIALGSASELEYHLLLSRDLGYLKEKEHALFNNQVTEVKRMLIVLIQRLNAKR
jgi:four helix bundle protein